MYIIKGSIYTERRHNNLRGVSNIKIFKVLKQKLTEPKGEMDKSTNTVGD